MPRTPLAHLLCPLSVEARRLVMGAPWRGPAPIVVGPGDGAARWVREHTTPGSLLILAGLAGGLREPPRVGEAVAVTEVRDEHGGRWISEVALPSDVPTAVALSVARSVTDPAGKAVLARRHPDAAVVDLESAAFAAAAAQRGARWIVVRGVSDGPEDALPPGVDEWVDERGRSRTHVVLTALARRQTTIGALRALDARCTAAMRAVRPCVESILAGLANAPSKAAAGARERLLIYGGTFDPPQRAHVELPLAAARALGGASLLYVPTSGNPLKDPPAASAEHRLAMLRIALRDVPEATISTIELEGPAPAYTVDTLHALRRQLEAAGRPAPELRLLIGADVALTFPRWKRPEEVLRLATPVVMLRPPMTRERFAEALRAVDPPMDAERWLSWILDVPMLDVSATEVRRRLAAGEPVESLVDPEVERYIREHGLYGTGGG